MTVLAASVFQTPQIAYNHVYPLLIVFGVAMIGVTVEAFLPRERRFAVQTILAMAGLVAAFVGVVVTGWTLAGNAKDSATSIGGITAEGAIAMDGPSLFIWGLLLILTLVSVMLFAERRLEGGVTAFAGQAAAVPGTTAEREASARGIEHTEIFPLVMFSVGGMMLFSAANDFLTMFVGLEVLSLPLYLLCGLARRRRLISQEAAMKYFLLGAFSSAFFIYGVAFIYGYTGSFHFAAIASAISGTGGSNTYLLIGIALAGMGLLFKTSAAPFHVWTPDVYHGAPTAVTGFMAACTKLAAFGALLRVFYVALGPARWGWQPMIWMVAVITMVVGCVVAITQTDMKRLLAYSSIAHAGFMLIAFVGAQQTIEIAGSQISSLQAIMFYLVAYGFSTVGAFAVITVVRDAGGEATHMSRWAGLGKESPLVAGVMSFFLLSFAGIPLTAGFTGKWAVFTAAWEGGAWPLVIIAVVMSAVAAFFYIKVIVVMFFSEPSGDRPTVAVPSVLTSSVITVGVAITLVLGIIPQWLLDFARQAGEFVR